MEELCHNRHDDIRHGDHNDGACDPKNKRFLNRTKVVSKRYFKKRECDRDGKVNHNGHFEFGRWGEVGTWFGNGEPSFKPGD